MAKASFVRRAPGTAAPAVAQSAAQPAAATATVRRPAQPQQQPAAATAVAHSPAAARPTPTRRAAPQPAAAPPPAAQPAPPQVRRRAAPQPPPAEEQATEVEVEDVIPQVSTQPAVQAEEQEPPTDSSLEETGRVESQLAFPTQMVQGQIDRSDLNIPSLKIVQAVGPMSELFEPGLLVLTAGGENSVVLAGEEQEIQLTVLRIRKQYIENLEYGSEERPRIFDTIEDVQAAGGWIEWHNNERPPFSPLATAVVVISCPEGLGEDEMAHFPFEFQGGRYALALWTMKGTAYTRAAKNIFTASVYSLTAERGGLPTGAWTLSTKRVKAGQNMVYAPILKQAGTWDPEFVQFLATLAS